MAGHCKTQIVRNKQRGFTIVELLIVIVVIAILAAIALVAYNGIQNRASGSTAQSDTRNAAEKMATDNVTNGSYASSAGAVDGGKGLPASPGTTYQYHSTGTTYCITATSGGNSYKISDTNPTPTAGGCPGDTVGGVAQITNLQTNPRLATNSTGYSATAPASTSWSPTGGPMGGGIYTATMTASGGVDMAFARLLSVQPNQQYAFSFYLNPSTTFSTAYIAISFDLSTGGSLNTSMPVYPTTGWGRYSAVFTAPANAVDVSIVHLFTSSVAAGGTYSMANAMVTQGGTVYNYADGSSPSWSWSGASDASTSNGPPL